MFQRMKDYFGDNYLEILEYYFLNGYVYSDNRLLILAIPHNKDNILNNNNDLDFCDCWYVQYASGDLKRAFEIMPYEMEWLVFDRGDSKPNKVYNLNKIRDKINGQ